MILLVRSEDRLDGGNRLVLVILDRNVLAAKIYIIFPDDICPIAGGDLQLHRQGEAGARHGCLKGVHALSVAVPPVFGDGQVHVAQTAVGDGPHDLVCNVLAVIGGFVGVVFALGQISRDPALIDRARNKGSLIKKSVFISDFRLPDIDIFRTGTLRERDPFVPDGVLTFLCSVTKNNGIDFSICLRIVHRHLHRLPMGGVAVVYPVLLDQDPFAGAQAVGDNGGVVAGLAVDGGLIGGTFAHFQDQVLIPAALFVVFREAV